MPWVISTTAGDLHFDPRVLTLTKGTKPIKLGAGQSLVLEMLCEGGTVDGISHGMATIGRPHDYESRVLHNHVMRLRRILGAEAIVTVRGRGYRLVTPVAQTKFHSEPSVRVVDIGPDSQIESTHAERARVGSPGEMRPEGHPRSCLGWLTLVEDRQTRSARIVWDARMVDPRAAGRARKLLVDLKPLEIWLDDGIGIRPADIASALSALTPARRITSVSLAAPSLPGPLAGLLDSWSLGTRQRSSSYAEAIARGLGNTTVICVEACGTPAFETIGAVNALYGEIWRRRAIGMPVEQQPDPDFGRNVRDAYLAPMALAAARSDPAAWEPRIERVAATILACPTTGQLASFDYDRLVLPLEDRYAIACTYIRSAASHRSAVA